MTSIARFADRTEAGKLLAAELRDYAARPDVLVLALPRGGVPVGFEIASALHVPLDVLVVRKLGVPFQPELAMGAIASGSVRVLNPDVLEQLGISQRAIEQVTAHERPELERRERAYRDASPPPDVHGRVVILVDDGLATGATMRAAIQVLRHQEAARVIVAVPVAPPSAAREFQAEADEFRCLLTPEPFYAIGVWYADFSQTSDHQVRELLAQASEACSKRAMQIQD